MTAAITQITTVTSHEIWERGTPVFWRSVADKALTPELALDYLGEMSTDIRAAVLLDGDGRLAAGSPDDDGRAERMRTIALELFERADEAAGGPRSACQVEVTLPDAAVFGVRSDTWTIAVVANRLALTSLMFYDLRSVLADLGGSTR